MSTVPKLCLAVFLVFQPRPPSPSCPPLSASFKVHLFDSIKTTLGDRYLLTSHDLIEAQEDDLARAMHVLRAQSQKGAISGEDGREIQPVRCARLRDAATMTEPISAPLDRNIAAAQAVLEAASCQLRQLAGKQQPLNPFLHVPPRAEHISKALLRLSQFTDQLIPFSHHGDARDRQKEANFRETWEQVKQDLAEMGYEATPAFNKSGLYFKGIRLNQAIPEQWLPYDQEIAYVSSYDERYKQHFLRFQRKHAYKENSRPAEQRERHRDWHSLKRGRTESNQWEAGKRAKLEPKYRD